MSHDVIYGDLLQPISAEQPAGGDVRYGPSFSALRAARMVEDPTLPAGVWKREPKQANWTEARRLAGAILKTESKDLQVAGWLLEADVRIRGFAALAPGLNFLSALCGTFWKDLYPELVAESPDIRNAPLDWLNEKLPLMLGQVPLTRNPPYTWADISNAQRHEIVRKADPTAAAAAEAAGRVPLETIVAAILQHEAVGPNICAALSAAAAAADKLHKELERLAGRDAPSIEKVQIWIGDNLAWLESIVPPAERAASLNPVTDDATGSAQTARPPFESTTHSISSRAEAYASLREAADYLLRTEPQSPVPHILAWAIALGATGSQGALRLLGIEADG